jgi:F-type H+-transporting ATPase subunit b
LRHIHASLTGLALVLLAAGLAHASGEGHEAPRWGDLAYRVITILLVVAAIWKLAGKKIASFFSGRRDGIAQELDDLEKRKEKARADLLAVERRIADLERERQAILADYEARGKALKAEIVAKAEESAAQILTQARQAAQNETDKALAAMREELAEKIVEAAGRSIAGSLSAKDHEKLLDGFLRKVVLQ